MQVQVVMAVDPRLYEKLDALTAALEKMASALHTADNGWKSSSQFCAEHRISLSTLQRRVEDGKIEVEVLKPNLFSGANRQGGGLVLTIDQIGRAHV